MAVSMAWTAKAYAKSDLLPETKDHNLGCKATQEAIACVDIGKP